MPAYHINFVVNKSCKMSSIYSKLLTGEKEYVEFKHHYDEASGANLPIEYFTGRNTYAFYCGSKMIAGLVIGTIMPFRTIEVFVNELDRNDVYSVIDNLENCCEVCAFWIAKKSYTPWRSVYIWFTMARAIARTGKDFYLGGTKAFGLANIYGYPRHSTLIYTGEVNGRQMWVFKALKKYVHFSALEVMIYKIKKTIYRSLFKKPTKVAFKLAK